MYPRIPREEKRRLLRERLANKIMQLSMLKNTIICPECGGTDIVCDAERGEYICRNCGYIFAYMMDEGPEWRAFDLEQKEIRSRGGPPITATIHDKGLTTTVGTFKSSTYHKLEPRQVLTMWRLRKWQNRIRVSGSKDRNLAQALGELQRAADVLRLPKYVVDTASEVYREALTVEVKEKSIQGLVGASIYIACKLCRVPRTLNSIARACGMKKRDVGKCYRNLLRALGIKIPRMNPKTYIKKFVNQLKLPLEVEKYAEEIYEKASAHRMTSGRGPAGMAAAAVYIIATLFNQRKTQRKIAKIAGVTEVTIRNRYKEFIENIDFIVEI